jgi:hypothetical protein
MNFGLSWQDGNPLTAPGLELSAGEGAAPSKLFQRKEGGKYQGGKNETAQSEIEERVSGNRHNSPHFSELR